jgi:hypothetical protein
MMRDEMDATIRAKSSAANAESMRVLCLRALQFHRPELWEEWSDDETLDSHLDVMVAEATVIARHPSSSPSAEELLVRSTAPHLVRAWAAMTVSNFVSAADLEAELQAEEAFLEP